MRRQLKRAVGKMSRRMQEKESNRRLTIGKAKRKRRLLGR
jgi:hypothetical protein